MGKSNIYIRADGSSQIGLGHLVRCIALAQILVEEFEICFVSIDATKQIIQEIKENQFEFVNIGKEADFFTILRPDDIVILDHYGLDSDYQKKLKTIGCKLVCIDDLHEGCFYADLIVNHAPGIKAIDYKAQAYTQFALGLEYVLLRREFLKAVSRQNPRREQGTILICFGGSDNQNLTKKCLQIVLDSNKFTKVIVVIGAAYLYKESLEEIIRQENNVKLFHSITADKMLELMQMASLAIVPSSGILVEAISAGCKVISGKYVENQQHVYSQYKNINAFTDAEDFSISAVQKALKIVEKPSHYIPVLIDGLSGNRLLKLFLQLRDENDIFLRNATIDDTPTTFFWARDKKIRAFSFSQKDILEEEHKLWFKNKLKSNRCLYFIAEYKDKAIGSIRFDIIDQVATISYLIDPNFHGRGFGVLLLKLGIKKALSNLRMEKIDTIVGYVMSGNIPSIKAFERLGFRKEVDEINLKFSKSL